MKRIMQSVLLAAGCLLGAVAAWKNLEDLSGTELYGGTVTGPVINVAAVGTVLLLLPVITTFVWPRAAAIGALAASALCLPLYVYRILPRVFRLVFPGLYKGPAEGTFIWHGWSITGVLSVVFVVCLSYRSFLPHGPSTPATKQ